MQHIDLITHRDGQRATGATLTNDGTDDGHTQACHFIKIAADRFGLATLFSTNPRVCARGINECHDGNAKLFGQFHQAQCLAITFRAWHAEIAINLFLGVASLLMTNHHDWLAIKAGQATHDCRVVGKGSITMQLFEIREDAAQVVQCIRTLRVASHLGDLRGGQFGI